jgi:hypothetical protein
MTGLGPLTMSGSAVRHLGPHGAVGQSGPTSATWPTRWSMTAAVRVRTLGRCRYFVSALAYLGRPAASA